MMCVLSCHSQGLCFRLITVSGTTDESSPIKIIPETSFSHGKDDAKNGKEFLDLFIACQTYMEGPVTWS
jgi:hypothetical protein